MAATPRKPVGFRGDTAVDSPAGFAPRSVVKAVDSAFLFIRTGGFPSSACQYVVARMVRQHTRRTTRKPPGVAPLYGGGRRRCHRFPDSVVYLAAGTIHDIDRSLGGHSCNSYSGHSCVAALPCAAAFFRRNPCYSSGSDRPDKFLFRHAGCCRRPYRRDSRRMRRGMVLAQTHTHQLRKSKDFHAPPVTQTGAPRQSPIFGLQLSLRLGTYRAFQSHRQ